MLSSDLNAAGIEYDRINIWEDPDAASFVRSVAQGYETVPTVTVGEAAMVNPSVHDISRALEASPQP